MGSHSRRRLAALGACVTVAVVVLAGALPASALTPRFIVNDGDQYARTVKVTAGDGGYSPYFRPGVVVWDGGSIVAGHGADPGWKFPALTLSVLPRVCVSTVSASPSARIADMLEEAPSEVDARYRETADLNLAVVLAGGGDFHNGASAASVYQALQEYCLARRAAGFRVVVLTVLPSARPLTFEASRLAYNAMLRDGWTAFADGLADLADDRRIGETGDVFDRQFYLADQLHPTNAGNAVMAAVTAPVLEKLPWRSARCELRVRDALGEWGEWRAYSPVLNVWLGDVQGVHVIEAEYRLDGGETMTTSDTIFLDSVRPRPRAVRDVTVRRGRTAVLRFRVDDAEPCGPTGTAVVTVKKPGGGAVKTFVRRDVPVNEAAAVVFKCRLPRGSYRYVITARDAAGNPQLTSSSAALRVR